MNKLIITLTLLLMILFRNGVSTLEKDGISVKETTTGLQLNLDGLMYKKIAQECEQGKFNPFYTLLKEFIKEIEKKY